MESSIRLPGDQLSLNFIIRFLLLILSHIIKIKIISLIPSKLFCTSVVSVSFTHFKSYLKIKIISLMPSKLFAILSFRFLLLILSHILKIKIISLIPAKLFCTSVVSVSFTHFKSDS